jgi:hypothetical protein
LTHSRTDSRLLSLLRADSKSVAQHQIDRLREEYISPVVRGVLSYELRRSIARTEAELIEQNEAFRDIEADVLARLNEKLWQIWDNRAVEGAEEQVLDICGYSGASARNACTDYLRKKYPGRHSLDKALHSGLDGGKMELILWQVEVRVDFKIWYIGHPEWKKSGLSAVSLEGDILLQSRLRRALEGKELSDLLLTVAQVIEAPLPYVELLNLLAEMRDVEKPYREARKQHVLMQVAPLHNRNLQPETEATRYAVIEELWQAVLHLSVKQRIALLFHGDTFEILLEIVEREIATPIVVAQSLEMEEDAFRRLLEGHSLVDEDIATYLQVEKERVRSIRQDARRHLRRHLEEKNLWL